MGILDRLFKTKKSEHQWIRFGRASDEVKTSEQVQLWDQAMVDFENQRYLDSFEKLLKYLLIPNIDNVRTTRNSDKIEFELEQGSGLVTGWMDSQNFCALAQITIGDTYSIGLMRQLLESSLELQHSRFAIDENNYLIIKFDGFTKESSPYRLFYGLREIALRADKQDDLLLSEFDHLKAVDNTNVTEYSETIKKTKYQYFQLILQKALDPGAVGKLDTKKYTGAWTYIYLSTLYKIDYLISPEGKSMEIIENAHKNYFIQNGEDILDKTEMLKESILELSEIDQTKLERELYYVHHTFGLKSAVPYGIISEFIVTEMNPLEWYKSQGHTEVSLAICHYIVGYLVYNFSLPEPANELAHYYFLCNDSEYFSALGLQTPELMDDESFKKSESKLKSGIRKIIDKHLVKFPELNTDVTISCQSRLDFCISYLTMMNNLNLNGR